METISGEYLAESKNEKDSVSKNDSSIDTKDISVSASKDGDLESDKDITKKDDMENKETPSPLPTSWLRIRSIRI